MLHTSIAPATQSWWQRENLVAGSVLLMVTALAWAYTLRAGFMHAMPMPGTTGTAAGAEMAGEMRMDGMAMSAGAAPHSAMEAIPALIHPAGLLPFLFGWAVMMLAMMLPATLPLVLLYRSTARKSLRPRHAAAGMGALLAGYVAIWTVAGLPVWTYSQFAGTGGPAMAVLPGLLLITGGIYQFTALKRSCHSRCSSPLFFLVHQWRPGVPGAARLGVLHGIDCLGCCVGLMLALVALGMMNVAWMLTVAVIIFAEKTLPGGHRLAHPLGAMLVLGGMVVLGATLLGGRS